MSEGDDGVEARRLDRGEHTEDEAGRGGEADGECDGPDGDAGFFEGGLGDEFEGGDDAKADDEPDGAADEAEGDGLDEELEQDDGGLGADGFAQADLAGCAR